MSFAQKSFVLKNDGTLWGCGYNANGELGLGDGTNRTTFTKITTNTDNIKSIYCGSNHTIILKSDGTLWGTGYNALGQLGLGDKNDRTIFTKITNDVKSVYCGQSHTFILKNDDTLWGCGVNTSNQLGLGEDANNKTTFTQITTNANDVKSACCGYYHTIILKNDGTLWGCGYNSGGRLGLGDEDNRTTFTIINSNPGNIKSVYCGSDYTLILQNNGTLWGCGGNSYGQLGLGDNNNRTIFTKITNDVKSVNCGYTHTIILKNNGTLWGCGNNEHNELGLGDTTNRNTFTQITTNTNDIKSVYCGYYHTIILKKDNTLWGCGTNGYGQLGLGDTNSRATFTQITTNVDNIKKFVNDYPNIPSIIKIYDTQIGYVETLDTNDFRNISVNAIEILKVLYAKPINTILNCAISFDKKQTWKTFNGTDWITISNISPENMILNCMEIEMLNSLDKKKLISGGFTGDLDFKIAMKTNNANKTPSVTKIYIEYK